MIKRSQVSEDAAILGKRRWTGTTKAERKEAMSRIASMISSEAASARALKAWATKRAKTA